MALKLFADTNIIIDLIEQRPHDITSVNKIFKASEENKIEIFVSESVLINALYVTGLDQQLYLLMPLVHLITISHSAFQKALLSSFKDKEDAILYYGALENRMNNFITRNVKDYKKHSVADLPVLSPTEFLKNHQL